MGMKINLFFFVYVSVRSRLDLLDLCDVRDGCDRVLLIRNHSVGNGFGIRVFDSLFYYTRDKIYKYAVSEKPSFSFVYIFFFTQHLCNRVFYERRNKSCVFS